MVSKKAFNQLKKEFGYLSSWTIWTMPVEGKPKSNIGDLTVFDNPDILNELNNEYIFVGLNAAEHDTPDDAIWGGFHSRDSKRQQDYKLRYALQGTKSWGSYITDAIKGLKETEGNKVLKEFKKNSTLREKSIKELNREIELLGGTPILVAIGVKANTVLSMIGDDLKNVKGIVKIPHYSQRINKDKYRYDVLEALK